MEIVELNISDIKPYERNAKKHPKKQVKQIAASIQEFGMCDPIGIWGDDNIIIEGHGRLLALKSLGYETAPCIRLDHLNDEQRRAYTLAHNKVAESEWEFDLLGDELGDIFNIDMNQFGFDFAADDEEDKGKIKQNERSRTDNGYNLNILDKKSTDGFYQMPIIECDNFIPKQIKSFNYALSSSEYDCGIHFFIDDYQFERVWNSPFDYVDKLQEFDCIFSPDFSLYTDMPIAMKIWNVYRSRLIGQFYQNCGLKVIPTISWCEKDTFAFCFDGIPKKSVVAVSTIGVKQSEKAFTIWKDGMDEMIKRIEPKTIIVYGGEVDYDYKNIKVVYFKNSNTSKFGEETDED